MHIAGLCSICGDVARRMRTCSLCGKIVCDRCSRDGVCIECLSKKVPDLPKR